MLRSQHHNGEVTQRQRVTQFPPLLLLLSREREKEKRRNTGLLLCLCLRVCQLGFKGQSVLQRQSASCLNFFIVIEANGNTAGEKLPLRVEASAWPLLGPLLSRARCGGMQPS